MVIADGRNWEAASRPPVSRSHSASCFAMPQLALLLTTVVWGATFPATKAALEQISPLSFLFLRFLLGTLVVCAVLVLMRRALTQIPLCCG